MPLKADEVSKRCYDSEALQNLATFKKNCDKCSMDLVDTRLSLDECVAKGGGIDAGTNFAMGATVGTGFILLLCTLIKCQF